MSNKLLLPNKFKQIGWFLLIPTTILGIILFFTDFTILEYKANIFAIIDQGFMSNRQWFHFIKTDITNEIVGILFIAGAMFVGFSKEKREDEFIAKLRLSSLLWAVWVNYVLLAFCLLFVFNVAFYNVMLLNMFTVLIIFIVRFNFILYKSNKIVADEK